MNAKKQGRRYIQRYSACVFTNPVYVLATNDKSPGWEPKIVEKINKEGDMFYFTPLTIPTANSRPGYDSTLFESIRLTLRRLWNNSAMTAEALRGIELFNTWLTWFSKWPIRFNSRLKVKHIILSRLMIQLWAERMHWSRYLCSNDLFKAKAICVSEIHPKLARMNRPQWQPFRIMTKGVGVRDSHNFAVICRCYITKRRVMSMSCDIFGLFLS